MDIIIMLVLLGAVAGKQVPHINDQTFMDETEIDIRRNIKMLETIAERQMEKEKRQDKIIKQLNESLQDQQGTLRRQNEEIQMLKHGIRDNQKKGEPGLYQYQEYGCTFDIIQLSCEHNASITVTSAYYGQYATPCESGCCTPHPTDDCQEFMADNRPQDWELLKTTCDNETSCEFKNPGSMLETCVEPYDSHYLLVNFECSAEVSEVGFAAYPSQERTYNDQDQIMYDTIITNTGGFYDGALSKFICPVSGLYLVSLSTYTYTGSQMKAHIMRGDTVVAQVWGNNEDYVQSSVTVVVECNGNQQVWVECVGDNRVLQAGKDSIFTGVLINEFK